MTGRRAWWIPVFIQRCSIIPKTLNPEPHFAQKPTNSFGFLRRHFTLDSSPPPRINWPKESINCLVELFEKSPQTRQPRVTEEVGLKLVGLRDELLELESDPDGTNRVLDEKGLPLFRHRPAFAELFKLLRENRHLAVEVFNWRRKNASFNFPITAEEYTMGIIAAGRTKNVDLAVELFTEAANNCVKKSCIYNAMLTVYMCNGFAEKCQLLFQKFKRDGSCVPNIVSYNILISAYGRLMMTDCMDATLQEIYDMNLSPNVYTFNNLIAGYVTAWTWDRMEDTFRLMRKKSIEPNTDTYLLMLRGYSHSGRLKEMEEMYELIKKRNLAGKSVVQMMICGYCKNPCADRIKKIEALMHLVPEEEYTAWFNVLLIKLYADEGLVDRMEEFINIAFEHRTAVASLSVMRAIITAYYRSNAVDRLADFVKRAECAEWRICRSLYHCKMVMYGSQNRMEEMENVLSEMEKFNISSQSKKTLLIMYKAYSTWGPRGKLEKVAGLMVKNGYGNPLDDSPL